MNIPASLAPHQQGGLLPIDISGAHARYVSRAEPKPKQQQDDRTVPPPLLPFLATGINEAGDLVGVEIPG